MMFSILLINYRTASYREIRGNIVARFAVLETYISMKDKN